MTDVIILSNAKSEELYTLTQQTINTCFATRGQESLNIIVIEQNRSKQYLIAQTWYSDEKFNYNKFANIGARLCSSENIVIANNDLVFTEGWIDNLLAANHPFVCPKDPKDNRQASVTENEIGGQVGRNLGGWCFLIKRHLWESIGGFDEDCSFWCSDNAVVEQCREFDILPMIVPSSIVYHLGSQTLKTMPNRDELTVQQVKKFNKKYRKNLFGWGE